MKKQPLTSEERIDKDYKMRRIKQFWQRMRLELQVNCQQEEK